MAKSYPVPGMPQLGDNDTDGPATTPDYDNIFSTDDPFNHIRHNDVILEKSGTIENSYGMRRKIREGRTAIFGRRWQNLNK